MPKSDVFMQKPRDHRVREACDLLRISCSVFTQKPRAHTVREACDLLRISRSHLYALAKRGELRLVRIGGRTLVPESEIERILATGVQP
jgi:excisionase family DNA binding protein